MTATRTRAAALLMMGAFALTGCGGGEDGAESREGTSALTGAYDECSAQMDDEMKAAYDEDAPDIDDMIRLEDDGTSLIVRTPGPGGELMSAAALMTTTCVLKETDAPSTILASMGSTNALSGRQSESYDSIDVDWSFAGGVGNAGFLATFTES